MLIQVNPFDTTPSYFSKIHFGIIFPPGCLCLRSGLPPSVFLTKTLYSLIGSPMLAICTVRFIILDFIIVITLGEGYKLRRPILYSFLQPPVTSSLFSPNILLSNLFPNNLSSCSSFNIRDCHPNTKPQVKSVVSYILIFIFLDGRWERVLNWMTASITQTQSALKFFINQILICFCVSEILELCHIFKGSVSCVHVMILSCILVTIHQHIVTWYACDYRRGLDLWIYMLTPYTHDLEVQVIIAPPLISTIHKLLTHTKSSQSSLAVFWQRLLTVEILQLPVLRLCCHSLTCTTLVNCQLNYSAISS
jgi:hypothetical protein